MVLLYRSSLFQRDWFKGVNQTDHDLSILSQVTEFAAHLARSLPSPSDTVAAKEFLKSFDDQLTPSEGQDDVSEEKKREIVTSLVAKVGELRGGLEAAKEFGMFALPPI